MIRPHRAAFVAGVLGLTCLAGPAGSARAADPAYPTGSYTLGTGGWMSAVDIGELAWTTVLVEKSVSDDSTPAGDVTRTFYRGDGTSQTFTPESLEEYGGALWVQYGVPGTFHPSVHLTDADGNTTVVALPAVAVRRDEVAPTPRITLPRPSRRHRTSGWQVIRGTVRDGGGPDPVGNVDVHVLQQRRGRWYSYDWDRKRWLRGFIGLDLTYGRWWTERSIPVPDASGRWRTPRIKGLTRGRLAVVVEASDDSYNSAPDLRISYRLVRR